MYYDWLLPLLPGRAHLSMQYSGRDAPRAWGEVAVFVRPLKPHSFTWMWLLRVLGLDCRGEPARGPLNYSQAHLVPVRSANLRTNH